MDGGVCTGDKVGVKEFPEPGNGVGDSEEYISLQKGATGDIGDGGKIVVGGVGDGVSDDLCCPEGHLNDSFRIFKLGQEQLLNDNDQFQCTKLLVQINECDHK